MYNIEEHVHRYAIWAAARAVQRNFTTTKIIKKAIEDINLKDRLKTLILVVSSPNDFDIFHKEVSRELITSLEQALKKDGKEVEVYYGRVAKIISIYIKTTYVIRDSESYLSKIAHPPIDSILLKNLGNVSRRAWTTLTEDIYFELIEELRMVANNRPFWELEEYWQPTI
ncbi:hypothetical protein I2I11_06540 [Pontibacter sp. 172403-2]|uniref:hypothetical protein n=1 Tax=Pontibacter rufus TaxID=2791028 RepID=UPI0018AFF2E1|nr:hypothetical protein [Pontibacter sp. 172403-2]MBF9252942.1 hypothetical protein [Pontibacter sp. 172403-2]